MVNYPRISIVTPSYNQGKYLEKTILSVIEQGYPNLEYIIIDGGSTDESVEIIRKYEQHLAYWVSEPDRGQSHAINKGFARATGDIFGWLNSDDWYLPEALRTVAETFAANPEAGAVVGGGDFVDEAGNVIVRTIPSKVTLNTLYSWFDNYFWQPSCFFTRQAWETAGRLDESLHLSMDYDLWLRIAREFTFATTGKVLSASLKHAEAKTTARLHESDHMTLKLVLRHGGEEALDIILASYGRRLAQFDEGARQQQESLSQTIKEQQREIRRLNSQLALVSIQRQKAAESLSRVTKEKEQLLGSLSWKMTRPVRNVLDRVKGHKRNEESESSLQFELFPLGTGRIAPIAFPACQEPLVSIIVPVHNQFPYTWSCLLSILRNTTGIPYEVIVADDASTDRTKGIGKYVRNVTIIRNDPNLGFLKNCNNAARSARGRYLVFLNNDVNVQADWLKFLLECAESDETVGMVGAKLVYPDGTIQEAGGIVWSDGSAMNYGREDDPFKPEYNYVKEVDYVSGACLLIRRTLWEQLGGFDERFVPAYYEDTDLAFAVRNAGFRVMLQPKSVAVHFEGQSHGTDVSAGIKSYQVRNRSIFVEKWRRELTASQLTPEEGTFFARDRSKGKKTVVFVDYEVPHFDMFAGSRTNFMYLKLLVSMGFNVKLLPADFQKAEPYTSEIEKLGVEVLYGDWCQTNWHSWLAENADNIDFVFFNKPDPTALFMDYVRSVTRAKILYQMHDLHHVRLLRKYEVENDTAALAEAERYRRLEDDIFTKADVVLTFSEEERGFVVRNYPGKEAVCLPLYVFESFREQTIDFGRREGLMFVGGYGHAPNADGVIWFVREVLPMIVAENSDIVFYAVGGNPPSELSSLESRNFRLLGQISDDELHAMYNKVRMVVIPLRYGAGVKGKTIEAMYEGVPVVSTSIGLEGVPALGQLLRGHDTAEEFAAEVARLYADQQALSDLSGKERMLIKNLFGFEEAKKKISAIFSENN